MGMRLELHYRPGVTSDRGTYEIYQYEVDIFSRQMVKQCYGGHWDYEIARHNLVTLALDKMWAIDHICAPH